MKVLWFTNTILPDFAKSLGVASGDYGGWMPSLLSAIKRYAPEIELHIASQGPSGKRAEVAGIHYYALGTGRLHRGKRVLDAQFELRAREVIDAVRSDVIHVHGSEGPYADLSADIWRGQRMLVSLQGIISAYYHYYYGNLIEADLRPYRNRLREWLRGYSEGTSRAYWKNGRSAAEQRLLGAASLLLGRTDWDRAWASFLMPEKPYAYVGEIMREPFYSGRRNDADLSRHTIFCGAALASPLKNGHVVLEAVAMLRSKYPDIVLHVANAASVGCSPTLVGCLREGEYVRYVRHLIRESNLAPNLVLHPSLSAEKVRDALARAELFCLPSACENSPNSLGEAMLTGTPAIATYVGGTPSILKNDVEGLLIPSGDPAAMAQAIDRYFSDRTFARDCAGRAYETAIRRYDPATVVKQLQEAYAKSLS